MRVNLFNPTNALTPLKARKRCLRAGAMRPLGLLTLAALTPADWEITVVDENRRTPDYDAMPRPDLVGITAFSSQAWRAYNLAAEFRRRGVPVVVGGIHASMCPAEAQAWADAVVVGEAGRASGNTFWRTARRGCPCRSTTASTWSGTPCLRPGTIFCPAAIFSVVCRRPCGCPAQLHLLPQRELVQWEASPVPAHRQRG